MSALLSGRRRLGLVHRHGFLGRDARFLEQGIAVDVLVSHPHRRGQRPPRVELARGLVDRGHRERGIRADERLLDVRALGRGEVLVLVHELHERRHEARARHLQRLLVDLQQQVQLGLKRHLEGVLLDRRVPDRVVRLHRREPHRLLVDLPVRLRDPRGLRRDARDLVLRHHAAAGEAPRPVDDDAHAEAVVLGVDDVLDAAVAGEDELDVVAVDADVGVARADLLRRRERGVGEVAQLGRGLRGQERVRRPNRARGTKRDHGLDESSAINHGGPRSQQAQGSRLQAQAGAQSQNETQPIADFGSFGELGTSGDGERDEREKARGKCASSL